MPTARTRMPTAARTPAPPARLTGPELLMLQLRARGYAPPQCCRMLGHAEHTCHDRLAAAVSALGAASLPEAIAKAKRRGLIV